jgi:hypothetical protein
MSGALLFYLYFSSPKISYAIMKGGEKYGSISARVHGILYNSNMPLVYAKGYLVNYEVGS